ncbi:aromatic alcohol reductase [Aspergillus novofumigatus IBT 16806]|uniref:NmrA-like family protein n=1 Tax=Aspergillus novofumigatus (strain IBT 16806) TaxID=1392255 RepID=A0A2I1BU05_ASPN1|nr:NmrA-like family protein [Aspergillus novofumigatus IBT 16806]PKX88880.1 NmrA-like family protein [Aspergillus novofumigatus IBT 16806]
MAYKNVVLVGAGSIGRIILRGLVDSSQFNITPAVFPDSVNVWKTDYSKSDLEAAFNGQDVVISALGALGFAEQRKLVDAAVQSGVKRLLPSEFSCNSQDEAVVELLPLFQQKADIIQYLKSKESTGLTWTGVVSSLLFDWVCRFLGYDSTSRTATIWDDGNKKFTLTNQGYLSKAIVSVLQRPNETKNQILYIASVETSQNEILNALENVTGCKWSIIQTTTEEQVTEARMKLSKGDFDGALTLVRATSYGKLPGLKSNYAKDFKVANDILGFEWADVEDTVRTVVSK